MNNTDLDALAHKLKIRPVISFRENDTYVLNQYNSIFRLILFMMTMSVVITQILQHSIVENHVNTIHGNWLCLLRENSVCWRVYLNEPWLVILCSELPPERAVRHSSDKVDFASVFCTFEPV